MTLEDLLQIREIEQLKYRYLRALDTHNWDLMAQCFDEQAEVWYRDGNYSFKGRDNILSFLRDQVTDTVICSHIALHPEVSLTGPDTATGVWRLQDIVHFTGSHSGAQEGDIRGGEKMEGAAYYFDDYVKREGKWLIAKTGYVRIFETISPKDDRANEQLKVDSKLGVK